MTAYKIVAGLAVVVAVLCAVGCSSNRMVVPQSSVFQPPASINTPGVYQEMPREMEHVDLQLTDTLAAYAPEDVHENATPLTWKEN